MVPFSQEGERPLRMLDGVRDIPEHLRNAIVSAEDGGFFDHAGLSISRMASWSWST